MSDGHFIQSSGIYVAMWGQLQYDKSYFCISIQYIINGEFNINHYNGVNFKGFKGDVKNATFCRKNYNFKKGN